MRFDINFLYRNVINHFSQKIVFPNGFTPAKPVNFSVTLTNRCNCRCTMCHYYKKQEKDLDYQQIEHALGDIRQWLGYPFFINITGGEALVYKDIYRLLDFCRNNSIYPTIITNGLLLNTRNCDKLIEAGLEYLNISIDSLKPDIHDELRGVPGLLKKALAGVEYLQENGVRVGVITVISNYNVEELASLTTELFNHHKIARLSFQPIRPTFGSDTGLSELCHSKLWINDMSKLTAAINDLIDLKKHYTILNSEKDFQNYLRYFNEPDAEHGSSVNCKVGTNNYMIDIKGDISFCTPLKPIGKISNKTYSASKIWNSKEAKERRLQTIRCRSICTSRCYRSDSLRQKINHFLCLRNH